MGVASPAVRMDTISAEVLAVSASTMGMFFLTCDFRACQHQIHHILTFGDWYSQADRCDRHILINMSKFYCGRNRFSCCIFHSVGHQRAESLDVFVLVFGSELGCFRFHCNITRLSFSLRAA